MNKMDAKLYIDMIFSKASNIVLEKLHLDSYTSITEFLSNYINLDILSSLDLYKVNGCLLKDGHPAYALYYDGDEYNVPFSVLYDGEHSLVNKSFDKPTILLSSDIFSDDILLETTIIHEVCHHFDGLSSGESLAKKLESEYLCYVHGYSSDAAFEYISSKYS